MLGNLNASEIDEVLYTEVTGRIGCHAEGRVYVVPVSFAYDGEFVYAHSADGLKVRTMRANPEVCFEVEQIESPTNWRTVVAWGRYEELSGHEEATAIRELRRRFSPLVLSETADAASLDADAPRPRPILYRIRLTERSGRFERRARSS